MERRRPPALSPPQPAGQRFQRGTGNQPCSAGTSLRPRFLMFSFLAFTKSKSFPYSSLQDRRGGEGRAATGAPAAQRAARRRARRARAPRPPLYAAEGVLRALLGLDLEVEGAGGGGPAGEVDEGDLVEADVHGRLVHVDEATLQRVEKSRAGLVGAGDALGAGVSARAKAAVLQPAGSKGPPRAHPHGEAEGPGSPDEPGSCSPGRRHGSRSPFSPTAGAREREGPVLRPVGEGSRTAGLRLPNQQLLPS